ncbi:hypothetical protein B0H63DRAFT_560135 [Podospora didyma]|uniref:Heterokaryon incompatibility domain-containing protein n=1 Tax=Podospora didyma TaxID=330526 RepID=A0AAE0NPZ4_9PEZI|nr:hypothetical protein B0H63DRAFT_560135 [Podospora didyma]
MRLLNVKTLALKDFGSLPPRYVILSHTWGAEVSFQDIQQIAHATISATKPDAFAKIQRCAEQPIIDGFEWIWVDTCCIDKTSSAELSEAINSMFAWYHDSYELLADFYTGSNTKYQWLARGRIQASRWFTRGWTLQEPIAPRTVEFFSSNWMSLGTRHSLANFLSGVTKVPKAVFKGEKMSRQYCAFDKMSWAASRTTTRVEDMAYCLLGLFGIHMPLLYGEGTRAFTRLQEEIIARSEDLSLLSWGISDFWLNGVYDKIPLLACQSKAFAEPMLTDITFDSTLHIGTAGHLSNPSRELSLQQTFPQPTVGRRGILATLFVGLSPSQTSGNPLDALSCLFAWNFVTATIDGLRLLVGFNSQVDWPPELLSSGTDPANPDNSHDGLEKELKKTTAPVEAWRHQGARLLCLDAREQHRLTPRLLYLMGTDEHLENNLIHIKLRKDHLVHMRWHDMESEVSLRNLCSSSLHRLSLEPSRTLPEPTRQEATSFQSRRQTNGQQGRVSTWEAPPSLTLRSKSTSDSLV